MAASSSIRLPIDAKEAWIFFGSISGPGAFGAGPAVRRGAEPACDNFLHGFKGRARANRALITDIRAKAQGPETPPFRRSPPVC